MDLDEWEDQWLGSGVIAYYPLQFAVYRDGSYVVEEKGECHPAGCRLHRALLKRWVSYANSPE